MRTLVSIYGILIVLFIVVYKYFKENFLLILGIFLITNIVAAIIAAIYMMGIEEKEK